MEVTYRVKRGDLWRGEVHTFTQSPRLLTLVLVPTFLFVFKVIPCLIRGDFLSAATHLLVSVAGPLWAAFLIAAFTVYNKMPTANRRRFCTVRIGPAGFECFVPEGHRCAAWQDVLKITETAHDFFVFDKRKSYSIPKRVFDSPEQTQAFLQAARTYWNNVKMGLHLPAPEGVWPPAPRRDGGGGTGRQAVRRHGQGNRQAAENPSCLISRLRFPMTVSYRMSMTDAWQYISYLLIKTITGRCLLALLLATPFVGPIALWYHTASLHQPAPTPKMQHLAVLTFWLMVGGTYVMILFSGLVGLYLGTLISPTETITIDSKFCCLKTFWNIKSAWKQFVTIAEGPDHFHFTGWTRTFCVPKRAFDSSAEASQFFETALGYWRTAKGIPSPPLPNVSGVWPPAPRQAESEEVRAEGARAGEPGGRG